MKAVFVFIAVSSYDTESESQVTWSRVGPPSMDSSGEHTEPDSGLGMQSISTHGLPASDIELLTSLEGGKMTLDFRIKEPYEEGDIYRLYQPMFDWVDPTLSIYDIVMVCPEELDDVAEDYKNLSILEIPSLAIVMFLSEQSILNNGIFAKAQKHFLTDDWTFHHTENISRSNVSNTPDNNQDYFLAEEGYPLCSVRKLHIGKSLLRFVRFISADNWQDNLSFYSLVLGQQPDLVKADFCLFTTGSQRDYDIQLALKRVPAGIKCKPTPQASLSFRITHLGNLVPLLPKRCCPGEHRRWETRDPDENHIIFEVVKPPQSKRLSVRALQKHNAYYGRMAVREQLQRHRMGSLSKSCTSLNMLDQPESPSWGLHPRPSSGSNRHFQMNDSLMDSGHHGQYKKRTKRTPHRAQSLSSDSLWHSKSRKSRSCLSLLDIDKHDIFESPLSSCTETDNDYRFPHRTDNRRHKPLLCRRQDSFTDRSDVSSSVYNIRARSDRKFSLESTDTYLNRTQRQASYDRPVSAPAARHGRYKKRSNSNPIYIEQFSRGSPLYMNMLSDNEDGNNHNVTSRRKLSRDSDKTCENTEYIMSKSLVIPTDNEKIDDIMSKSLVISADNDKSRSPDEGIDVNDLDDVDGIHLGNTPHGQCMDSSSTQSGGERDALEDSMAGSEEGSSCDGLDPEASIFSQGEDGESSCAGLDPEASIFSQGEDDDSIDSADDLCDQNSTENHINTPDVSSNNNELTCDNTTVRKGVPMILHRNPDTNINNIDNANKSMASHVINPLHVQAVDLSISRSHDCRTNQASSLSRPNALCRQLSLPPSPIVGTGKSPSVLPQIGLTKPQASHTSAVSQSANNPKIIKKHESSAPIFKHPFFQSFHKDPPVMTAPVSPSPLQEHSTSGVNVRRTDLARDPPDPHSAARGTAVSRRVTFLERVDSRTYSDEKAGLVTPSQSPREATLHRCWTEAQHSGVGFFVWYSLWILFSHIHIFC